MVVVCFGCFGCLHITVDSSSSNENFRQLIADEAIYDSIRKFHLLSMTLTTFALASTSA
jgi:hypothetical protein